MDTVAEHCAAAVFDSHAGRCLHAVSRKIGKGHAEQLMQVIEEALAGARVDYGDIERIAVAVGPGSFTGVRVGVAAARGLALALSVPAVGISTLAALAADAQSAHPACPVLVAIDARRGEIYWQRFDGSGMAVTQPCAAPLESALPHRAGHLLAGNAAPLLVEPSGSAPRKPVGPVAATAHIATYARLGAEAIPGAPPRPLYLRAPDAKPQAAPIARARAP